MFQFNCIVNPFWRGENFLNQERITHFVTSAADIVYQNKKKEEVMTVFTTAKHEAQTKRDFHHLVWGSSLSYPTKRDEKKNQPRSSQEDEAVVIPGELRAV